MAYARQGGFIVSSGAEFKETRWTRIAATLVRSRPRSQRTIELTIAGEGVAAYSGIVVRTGLSDATYVDVRDVEVPPASVGREHRTPFDETGREAGAIAQPQTGFPRRRAESTAQQRRLRSERKYLDAQRIENERHFGSRPPVLMKTGRHLRDVHGGHRRAGPQRVGDEIGARLLQHHGEHRRGVQDGSRQRLLRRRFRAALGDELVHHARAAAAPALRYGAHPREGGVNGLNPDAAVVQRQQHLLAGPDTERPAESGRHDDTARRGDSDTSRTVVSARHCIRR